MIRYLAFLIILFVGCQGSEQKTRTSKKSEVVLDSLNHPDSGYRITERPIPPNDADIFNFLESLKWKEDSDSNDYSGNNTPNWNIPLLITHISDSGVLFIDPNDDFNKKIEKKQIERELNKRKGKSYEMISYFTFLYSIPFRQYSELKFEEKDGDEVVVTIGTSHELTFETKLKKHYLIKCEYLELEGE
ncbi:MAG: hypothetical protein ACJ75B_07510 [Flavisolibacter sp.]